MTSPHMATSPVRPVRQAGLALLDVLLGMAIFSLIVIIGIQSVSQFRARAFQVSASSDAQQLSIGLESHFTDTGFYPAKADLAAFMASYGINLTRGVTVPGYARNNGEVQFCTTHKAGGTAAANITAWSIYDSRYGAVTSSGRGAATAPAFCTGGAPTWDGFVEATPGATPTVTATPTTAAPTPTPTPTPTPAPAVNAIDTRVAMSTHGASCAVRPTGRLYCWGRGQGYTLGLGDTNNRTSPTQVGTASNWASVSLEYFGGCGLRQDGSLWCWGYNYAGQAGTGSTSPTYVTTPTRVGTDNDWIKVEASNDLTCAEKVDRSMWCWGSRYMYLGSQVNWLTPTRAYWDGPVWRSWTMGLNAWCGVKSDNTLWCSGNDSTASLSGGNRTYIDTGAAWDIAMAPRQVGSSPVWREVASNNGFCALRDTGTTWCWGDNRSAISGSGAPRNPTELLPVLLQPSATMLDSTQLAIGGGMVGVPIDTACTLTAAGAARCWGYLASGSGTGSSSPGYSPVTSVANGITGIKSISPGTNTTCYVRASDESVWCWGDNTVGGVGQGSGAASFYATPQQVLFP